MKPHLRNLRISQKVWAIIDDVIAKNELVVNFSGDLIRVRNNTEKTFRVGERVLLQVRKLNPLKFSFIVLAGTKRSPHAIDISV